VLRPERLGCSVILDDYFSFTVPLGEWHELATMIHCRCLSRRPKFPR
jgi:hypothetical protein